MTLLFFLRSPAGNTDTARSGDVGRIRAKETRQDWEYEDAKQEKEKKREKQRQQQKKKELKTIQILNIEETRKVKRKRDEELLMILFMHEFDNEH